MTYDPIRQPAQALSLMASHTPGLKKILLNGIEVGEYVATGDMQRDAEAAQQILIAKGLHKPISPLQAMYNQAVAFCSASSDLYGKHFTRSPFNGLAAAPFVVNAAFSIELYLKTLHAVEQHPARIHELLKLYDSLPPRLRAAVDAEATKRAPEYKLDPSVQYRAVLSQLDNAFQRWRYIYESSTLASVDIPETIFVMRVLHEVCTAELHPKT